ncbi:FGGY family carbohydrate kinase [Subtercola lobariae]|uniref:Xylulose kinase n=1 Tax=Subtercola lobariae TaxID=1588641 RepID=A0A917AZB3_9MICO|nr:FGGY family carbohydrate kinase [Subtercola lobariae]GGF12378.1 xylulokinase [Subtercola lobariae]
MSLVAGVDSSTQSCKVVIRDSETGALVREGRAGHPEGTEVDPAAWWDALQNAIADAGGLADVSAVSIGGQQHGMVVLDAGGRVIRDAVLWNDTRSAAAATALIAEAGRAAQTDSATAAEAGAEVYAERTGSVPVASFTATKLRWLRDAEPANAARVAAVALPHDWLTWRLLGYGPADESPLGPVLDALTTDRSDASGTSYWSPAATAYDFDLFELAFGRPAVEALGVAEAAIEEIEGSSAELVDELLDGLQPGFGSFGVDGASGEAPLEPPAVGEDSAEAAATPVILPRIVQSGDVAGVTVDHPGDAAFRDGTAEGFPASLIPAGILVGAGAGDNAGAALGLGLNATAGDVVISIGTSGTAFAVTDHPVADATGTVAGFADAAGAFLPLIATLNAARILASISTVLGVDYDEFARLALAAEPGSGGVVLVPYFEGERTPNLPDATATFAGLTLANSTRENFARAAIEGMLCALADGLAAVRSLGVDARRVLLVGGAAQNAAVQAVAAEVFDVPVSIPAPGEYVADGAARQAAWTLTGTRPTWPVAFAAELAAATVPLITQQYRRAQSLGSLPR